MSIEDAKRNIECGAMYPYDALYTGQVDWAHEAARGILYDFGDRRGIKHVIHDVDSETRNEIVQSMAATIRAALDKARGGK